MASGVWRHSFFHMHIFDAIRLLVQHRRSIVMNIHNYILCLMLCMIQHRRIQGFTFHTTPYNFPAIGQLIQTSKIIRRQSQLRLSADSTNFSIDMDGNDDNDDDSDDDVSVVNESELVLDEDDLDDEDEEDENSFVDAYVQVASSEFNSNDNMNASAANDLVLSTSEMSTSLDWGGALGKLRQRFDDIDQGKSGNPSQALFRLMSAQSPNQAIGSFINSANPQVVQAMSGAVSSLLGGLSSPTSGIETIVKATGSKIGTLCFQLQMTGYMFRNVEYVIALKDIMKLRGSATLQDYKSAFERLDEDDSGYIESSEVANLLDDVYDGKTPVFEVQTFIKFFDKNNDGKISWDEFEKGLGVAMASSQQNNNAQLNLLPQGNNDDEDDDDEVTLPEPDVSGTVQIEFKNGKVVEVDAKEYIQNLKDEAKALKEALARGRGSTSQQLERGSPDSMIRPRKPSAALDDFGAIANYIASQQGDVKALTQGISPEIVETMKMLINFVLEGGDSGKGKDVPKDKMEMEIPGSALQQLALWQLVLGYRLREAEAKGDYLKLLE